MNAPIVGQPFTIGDEVLVPTYVAESEAPTSTGACNTRSYITEAAIDAAGWYIEFHYPGRTDTHRRYIPFPGGTDGN